MVTLGFIDPDRYLGGRFDLHPELAKASLERDLTTRFGWSTEEAAAAIHDLVVMNMATAVHEVSVAKGYDPRDFLFLAYGGTLPLFAVQIAERLNISRVVIPQNSSVFSALGLLSADFVMRYDQTVAWDLASEQVDEVNGIADEMIERARAAMQAEGFADEDIEFARSADFRFLGQSSELTVSLPERPLAAEDAPQLAQGFFELYERTYGEGTAWKGVPVQLLNYTVTVTGRQHRPGVEAAESSPIDADELRLGVRRVFLPSTRDYADVPIYDDTRFTAGTTIAGPAIIDATDTTIYVPPGSDATRDEYMNYVLTTDGGAR
jgi:N-methylhydantoinase A